MEEYIIFYTSKARKDLNSIFVYIAYELKVFESARNTTRRIINTINNLKTMPERHPLLETNTLQANNYHKVNIKNHLIIYQVDNTNKRVIIIRILYSKQNIENILKEL